MTSAVVFDLGGVVCRFDPNRRLQALSAATGLTMERVDRALWKSGLDAKMEAGELSPDEAHRAVSVALENRLVSVALRGAWSTAFVPDQAVCRLVEQVRPARYLFTNNGPIVTECLSHELQDISRLFRRTVCSWELRARKPDPLAFDGLAHELGWSPSEMAFVDDVVANCEAAESVGMQAIHFSDRPSLARSLDHLGLIVV